MKRAAAQLGVATIVVAIVGYVVQFLAARWLGPAEFTQFAVFWALLFIVVALLGGVAQESIRVSRAAKLRLDEGLPINLPTSHHPRIAVVAISVSVCIALAVALSGLLWGPQMFASDWPWAIGLLGVAAILVSGGLAAGAIAVGMARWRLWSSIAVLEALARLIFFLLAAVLLPSVLGFSIAAVLAFVPSFAVVVLWARLRRDTLLIRSDSGVWLTTTRILRAMAAAGLSGVLVIGWPVLLSAASGLNARGATSASVGILVLLVTLTRAPIMVPLTAAQNALLARFTGFDLTTRRRWVAVGTCVIAAGSIVLACLAALVGPPLLPILFGDDFVAGPELFATLTAASGSLGIITLTGVAALTAQRHSLYLYGWGTAIASSLVLLFLAPVPFDWAAVAALAVGPLMGAAVHLAALRRPRG